MMFQGFKLEASKGNIEFQDAIIFPLFFCHRHCVELELKYSAITFCRTYDDVKQIFCQGHDLTKIWNYIRPQIRRRADRIGCYINYNAITHYITKIQKLDHDSFNYRYPTDKTNLTPTINKLIELDVPNMHFKLLNFHNYIIKVVQYVSNQCDYLPYDKNFKTNLRQFLKNNCDNIFSILNYKLQSPKFHSDKIWLKPSDIPYIMPDEDIDFIFAYNVPAEIKKVILYFYLAKSHIESYNLATNNQEYIKDIYRILYYHSTNSMFYDDSIMSNYFQDKFSSIIIENKWYCTLIDKIISNFPIS